MLDAQAQVAAAIDVPLPAGQTEAGAELEVPNPQWWSPDHPHLYQLEAALLENSQELDSLAQTFGFRTIEARDGALFLNGERLYLLTVNGELVCLSSTNGKELWRKSYVTEFGARRPVWGFCDHPFVDGEKLICTPATTNAAMVALNKVTGEMIWGGP